MAGQEHHYKAKLLWTGAEQGSNKDVRSFSREYRIDMEGKAPIRGSSDPAFRGDPALHNPEDLLVAALAACHMLWYLHLCAVKGVEVLAYEDQAEGTMLAEPGNGRMTEVTLHPKVTVVPGSDRDRALSLHRRAHDECYVANSVNFPVRCEPEIVEGS